VRRVARWCNGRSPAIRVSRSQRPKFAEMGRGETVALSHGVPALLLPLTALRGSRIVARKRRSSERRMRVYHGSTSGRRRMRRRHRGSSEQWATGCRTASNALSGRAAHMPDLVALGLSSLFTSGPSAAALANGGKAGASAAVWLAHQPQLRVWHATGLSARLQVPNCGWSYRPRPCYGLWQRWGRLAVRWPPSRPECHGAASWCPAAP
jgi:hypothetical protein